jgi:hypothetical protein
MCTLTYIPETNNGFLLVSNRDESIAREPALAPEMYLHNGIAVVYPKDTQAGGTWLATAANGFTLCLLNGAFERHLRKPPYRHSRGLVVTGFFNYNDVDVFLTEYDFEGIEPFTLVIIQRTDEQTRIREIRWDGASVYHKEIDGLKPNIWSSATLYDKEVIAEREKWFHHFLVQQPHPDLNDMLQFHHFGGTGDERNDLLMNRDNVLQTISITGIKSCHAGTFMHHEDLLTHTFSVKEITV